MLVSVIIPTQRGIRWLPTCLASLQRQTFNNFEIVIIDNASEDGTREWLATQNTPNLRIIRNATNKGFAVAINQGIRATNGAFVAVLNDDTEVEHTWLADLLDAITPTEVGSVASLMLYANQPNIIQSAGIAIDTAAIAWDWLAGEPMSAAGESITPIFGASGGAALFKRAMLDQIGLYDEQFFAYLEDVDLAWRAQRAGWQCVLAPNARVLHHTSATSGEASPFKRYLLGRNKIWMIAKNARLADIPIIVFYDALAVAYRLLVQHDLNALRGRVAGIGGISQAIKIRRKQPANNKKIVTMAPVGGASAVLKRFFRKN